MLDGKKIGFIGGGQMCEAIFSGILSSKSIDNKAITVTDINAERLTALKNQYGINTIDNIEAKGTNYIAENCDIIFLTVKPQLAATVLSPLYNKIKQNQLVISIMGGITLEKLDTMLGKCRLIRVMPNLPMQVQKGVAGLVKGKAATAQDMKLATYLFSCVGSVFELPEKLIDPLTSISGCGPAFAYMFIQALADGGVELGLPRDMAINLAAQTLLGSAEMVLQTGVHPDKLKDNVCSPGGGTIAGVHSLEQNCFRGTVADAVIASCKRMQDVGKKA